MKRKLGSALLTIAFISCSTLAVLSQDTSHVPDANDCASSGVYYHREARALPTEVIAAPFVVRDITGTVTYNGGKPLEGANVEMLLGRGSTIDDETSIRGRFTLSSLHLLGPFSWSAGAGLGTYCFRVTKAGFHSAIGVIVVSRTAPKEAVVAIDLKPGEGYRDTPPDEQLLPPSSVAPFAVPNPKKYPQKYAAVYMPVSLAAGRVRTPEFTVAKGQWYDIMLRVELPPVPKSARLASSQRMRCLMGTTFDPADDQDCEANPIVRADWTVWVDGRIVRWGSMPDEDHAIWGADDMYKQIGDFPAEPGKKYVVQVHFTKDGTDLNVANPQVVGHSEILPC